MILIGLTLTALFSNSTYFDRGLHDNNSDKADKHWNIFWQPATKRGIVS